MAYAYLRKVLPLNIRLILIFSFFLNVYAIWWGLPSFIGWAVDEVSPQRVLWAVSNYFSNGWYDTYPPFHYYVLTILYLPCLILHKLKIVDVQSLPTYTILFYLGRFLSVLMGTATVFVVYLCGREIYDNKSSLFAALITALNTPFIYYSKTTNVEVPYIFWFALSLLFYIRILKHHKTADYLLFTITCVTSVCTKDQAYGFYILTGLFIIVNYYLYIKSINNKLKIADLLQDRNIIICMFIGISLFVIYHNILFNWNGFIGHIKELAGPASYNSSEFLDRPENNISEHLKLFWRSLTDIRRSWGWPVSILCLLGLGATVIQNRKNYLLLSLLIPALSYYVFFISVILYSRDRFMIPICIILSFFGGKLVAELLRDKTLAILFSLIFFYTFLHAVSVNILMAGDSRYYVESWMRQNINEKAAVLSVGIKEYLPRFELQKFAKIKNVTIPEEKELEKEKIDYIITTSSYNITRFDKGTKGYEAFEKLNSEKMGYKLILQYQSKPKWNFLDIEEIPSDSDQRYMSGNLNKINPEIKIFKKM